jgi:hypothetical protein
MIAWACGETLPWWSWAVIFQIALDRFHLQLVSKQLDNQRDLSGKMVAVIGAGQHVLDTHIRKCALPQEPDHQAPFQIQ